VFYQPVSTPVTGYSLEAYKSVTGTVLAGEGVTLSYSQ
jgi:hypothetical protein